MRLRLPLRASRVNGDCTAGGNAFETGCGTSVRNRGGGVQKRQQSCQHAMRTDRQGAHPRIFCRDRLSWDESLAVGSAAGSAAGDPP